VIEKQINKIHINNTTMAKEIIKITFVATRPYNRLYVGFSVEPNQIIPSYTTTTHFDGQYDGKWHKAVASLIHLDLLTEHPQYDYLYHDDCGKEDLLLNSEMSLEQVEQMIKDNYIEPEY
jgi:hypothetical protein